MIAEVKSEYKVSVIREAIESVLALRPVFGVLFHWAGRPDLERLLLAAWLSLPKCLVCGAEDGQSGRALVLQYMFGWFIDRPAASWREPVCACRRHPSIKVFEEF